MDFDLINKKCKELRDNTVAKNSKKIYASSQQRFLSWVVENKPELLPADFNTMMRSGGVGTGKNELRLTLKRILEKREIKPLIFENLKAEDFIGWIVTLEKGDGRQLSFSCFNGHRAALFNLFRDYGEPMTKNLENELSLHFKGLKRTVALDTSRGMLRIKKGKDPLSFEMYSFLGMTTLRLSSKDLLFSRTFMIISWNLMCRSSNAISIRYGHMEFLNDSLGVYFSHMKNDQIGERPRDPRHIYANPLKPEICPILALAIYWAIFSFDCSSDQLFQGNNQYERFRKSFQHLFKHEDISSVLIRKGLNPENIGTHSMRKGAATFCSSGSTACPSSTSIHLRAGWSLGGVQNTYLRYEAAGDQYVGRVVSGLPLDSFEFSILPPHFSHSSSDIVKKAIQVVYPDMPLSLYGIGEMALASLVYHLPFLRSTLPNGHRLFNCSLFLDIDLLKSLSMNVKCGYRSKTIVASGIPPHVNILSQMKDLKEQAISTLEKIEENRHTVVKDIINELEKRAIGAGTVTYDGLSNMIMSCLEESGLLNKNKIDDSQSEIEKEPNFYVWNDGYHRLPQEYVIPDGGVKEVWLLWTHGSRESNIPPLKYVKPSDFNIQNQRKRYSELKFLCNMIDEEISQKGLNNRMETIEASIETFTEVRSVVEVSSQTRTSRSRRRGQISWRTVVNILRRK